MGWISPKEALRRYNQRRRDKKREKFALAHPLPRTPTPESSACIFTASIDPIVEFSGREIILKTCTPVRPPADPAMAVNLRRSSVDIWDRVDEDRREITKANQRTSSFLRLAPEIRNMIYNHALGSRTYRFKDNIPRGHATLDTKGEHHILALIFVCHQIYSEASLLPYSLNTFSFREFENSFKPFLDRRQFIQSQAITTIELVTYQAERMWAGSGPESDTVKEVERTKAWERLPHLKKIRVIVDLNASLYVEYSRRDFDYRVIRDNQSALEDEIRRRNPLILVSFIWG